MRKKSIMLFGLVSATLAACGDDAVKPGNLVVHWSEGPTATCGGRGHATIEARLLSGDEVVYSGSGQCPAASSEGTIGLTNITPGTYKLEVEGVDATGKGTYLGVIAKQSVAEGKTTDTATVALAPKPARLHVDWTIPGGKCSSSNIKNVQVSLYYKASNESIVQGAPQKVTCDNTVKDPDDPKSLIAGVLFTDLETDDDAQVVIDGFDASNKKVASGKSQKTDAVAVDFLSAIGFGDDLDVVVNLTAVP